MNKTTFIIALLLTLQSFANSLDQADSLEFHELLRSSVPEQISNDDSMAMVHMLPNQILLEANGAPSIDAALEILKKATLSNLHKNTLAQHSDLRLNANQILTQKPITLVLVPGIFGEFIKTRAFEDVLSKPSSDRNEFEKQVKLALNKNDSNATDSSFDPGLVHNVEKPLSDLIHIGSITDESNKTLVRVVLINAPYMSLESMGSLEGHAALFNRRISKYLALTGPQDLAFIGYSRGTVLGLEMLAQAKTANLSWLPSVKAMIALGGVAWGSSLADNTENPNAPVSKLIKVLRQLEHDLDPDSFKNTALAWMNFTSAAARLAPEINGGNKPTADDKSREKQAMGSIDTGSIVDLVMTLAKQIGLLNPFYFQKNVVRFKSLVSSILDGVQQLTTCLRMEWWKTHELPKSVKYYSVAAAMANPNASEFDRRAFNTAIGYNNTYDDSNLLKNRIEYEAVSGIALNDSQVSVAQAMFLPNAIANINPVNNGLNTSFLGVLGTHHWGLALRTVTEMKDHRMNPFPREALLKALAAKVARDVGSHIFPD